MKDIGCLEMIQNVIKSVQGSNTLTFKQWHVLLVLSITVGSVVLLKKINKNTQFVKNVIKVSIHTMMYVNKMLPVKQLSTTICKQISAKIVI